MDVKELAEVILAGVQTQRFFNWHGEGGRFEQFIQGDEDAPSREEILADIERIFLLR